MSKDTTTKEIIAETKKIPATTITPQPIQTDAKTPVRPVVPEILTPQQALQILVDAARISQSKGIFSLEDAEIVAKAIRTFTPPTPQGPVASQS